MVVLTEGVHCWFVEAAARVGASPASTKIQWNALPKSPP